MKPIRQIKLSGAAGVIFILAVIAFVAFVLGSTLTGLYLAFSASAVLGIAVFLIEPLPMLFGLAYWLTGTDLAQKLMELFK